MNIHVCSLGIMYIMDDQIVPVTLLSDDRDLREVLSYQVYSLFYFKYKSSFKYFL